MPIPDTGVMRDAGASTSDTGVETDAFMSSTTIALRGQVIGSLSDSTPVLANAQVCVGTNCATTDATGNYMLQVAANSELLVRVTAADSDIHWDYLFVSGERGASANLRVLEDAAVESVVTGLGQTLDPTRGHVLMLTGDLRSTGTLAPSDAASVAYSQGPAGFTTGSSGYSALFMNVVPGAHQVTAMNSANACTPTRNAWPATGATSRVPVSAGAVSVVSISCTP